MKLWFWYFSHWHGQVKEEMLFEALTTRKTVTVGEKLIVPYRLAEVSVPAAQHTKYLYIQTHKKNRNTVNFD